MECVSWAGEDVLRSSTFVKMLCCYLGEWSSVKYYYWEVLYFITQYLPRKYILYSQTFFEGFDVHYVPPGPIGSNRACGLRAQLLYNSARGIGLLTIAHLICFQLLRIWWIWTIENTHIRPMVVHVAYYYISQLSEVNYKSSFQETKQSLNVCQSDNSNDNNKTKTKNKKK